MQATTMFFGEALAYLVYLIMLKKDPEAYEKGRIEA